MHDGHTIRKGRRLKSENLSSKQGFDFDTGYEMWTFTTERKQVKLPALHSLYTTYCFSEPNAIKSYRNSCLVSLINAD